MLDSSVNMIESLFDIEIDSIDDWALIDYQLKQLFAHTINFIDGFHQFSYLFVSCFILSHFGLADFHVFKVIFHALSILLFELNC